MFRGYIATSCSSRKLCRMKPTSIPPRKTRDSAGHCLSSYNYHMTCPCMRATPLALRYNCTSEYPDTSVPPSSRDYHGNDVGMSMNNILKPHYARAWVGLLDPVLKCQEYFCTYNPLHTMCTYSPSTYICVHTAPLHTYVYIQPLYIHMCTYNCTTYIYMCTYNSTTYICVHTAPLHTYVYIQLYYIHMCTYNSTTYICVHTTLLKTCQITDLIITC